MGKFIDALRTKTGLTENGMQTNETTLNSCLDLFFQIGAMRGMDEELIEQRFAKAWGENPEYALKILFWGRDIRGGAGERETFRVILKSLLKLKKETVKKNLKYIPEYGRWDDLFIFLDTSLKDTVLELISKGLEDKNQRGLLAKWLPRPNGKNKQKKYWANIIRKHLGLTPKEYRKMLVEYSDTVEQKMCRKEYSLIDYSKVPSKAMSNYMSAFKRNDGERFEKYIEELKSGKTTVNVGAIYPYDIIKSLRQGNHSEATAQWNELPNYMENNQELVLPIVDVSGSMFVSAGNNPNLNVMDIAISLGLYISERNEGKFKDAFITFSTIPELVYLQGDLATRYLQLRKANWDMSTNLKAVFDLILNKAIKNDLSQSEMPTMLLILSDMEFDSAMNSRYHKTNWDSTAHEMIEKMYNDAGYKMPKIVYWNLRARNNNFPVQKHETGAALISGFSPQILTSLLDGESFNPLDIMYKTIITDRYKPITI